MTGRSIVQRSLFLLQSRSLTVIAVMQHVWCCILRWLGTHRCSNTARQPVLSQLGPVCRVLHIPARKSDMITTDVHAGAQRRHLGLGARLAATTPGRQDWFSSEAAAIAVHNKAAEIIARQVLGRKVRFSINSTAATAAAPDVAQCHASVLIFWRTMPNSNCRTENNTNLPSIDT